VPIWLAGLVAALFNVAFWFCMLGVQTWEQKTGRIPPRQKEFPYLQDFWTNGFVGDGIGLGLVDAAVAVTVYQRGFTTWMIVAVAAGMLLTVGFYKFATAPIHKPNWGFMDGGNITWGGRVHLVYFAVQATVATIGFVLLFALQIRGIPLAIGLSGIAAYLAALAADVAIGRLPAVKRG